MAENPRGVRSTLNNHRNSRISAPFLCHVAQSQTASWAEATGSVKACLQGWLPPPIWRHMPTRSPASRSSRLRVQPAITKLRNRRAPGWLLCLEPKMKHINYKVDVIVDVAACLRAVAFIVMLIVT